jgi:hypothetical protein
MKDPNGTNGLGENNFISAHMHLTGRTYRWMLLWRAVERRLRRGALAEADRPPSGSHLCLPRPQLKSAVVKQ